MNIAQHDWVRRSFSRIGADVRIWSPPSHKRGISVDIERSGRKERFEIRYSEDSEFFVANIQPKIRHLLLMIRGQDGEKSTNAKILCGHDERHLFAASIPDDAGATVRAAMTALKPEAFQRIESYQGVKPRNLHSRRRKLRNGEKIYRQGEFMFVPQPDFLPAKPLGIERNLVLSRAAMRSFRWERGFGNPHVAQEAYRKTSHAVRVYVNDRFPEGITDVEWYSEASKDPSIRELHWTYHLKEPEVYVRGTIRHPEHATIDLGRIWYRVYVNTEDQSSARGYLAYRD